MQMFTRISSLDSVINSVLQMSHITMFFIRVVEKILSLINVIITSLILTVAVILLVEHVIATPLETCAVPTHLETTATTTP